MEAQAIEVTEDWLNKLKAQPFISSKSFYSLIISIAHRGRTLHLLKQSSKPVPQQRKRRKITIFATPLEFVQQ